MKTYFEWQTPAGFRPSKNSEALRKAVRPVLLDAVLGVFILGIIILVWFVIDIKRGSHSAALFFVFGSLVVLLLVFPPIWVFMLVVSGLRGAPRSGRNVKLTKDKVIFGEGRRGSWEYKDVQSFRIVEEEFRGTTISVLEMQHFDGDYLSLGITPDVPMDSLRAILSERLIDARNRAKNIFARKAGARLRVFAALLMCCSLVAFIIFSGKFFIPKSDEKLNQEFATRLTERMGELESEQVDKEQLGRFKKVAGWYLSTESLAESNKMLIGMSISMSVFLLGCVLMLWGHNMSLRNKIIRVQAYLVDISENRGTSRKA